MPLSGEALQEAGNSITRGTKPTNEVKYASIATDSTLELEKTAANLRKTKVKAGTVPATGAVVVLSNLNGKTGLGEEEGGLVVGIPYYLHKVSSTEYGLAYVKTAAESATEAEWIEVTVEIKTESRLKVIEEHTGGKTTRKEVKWKAADKNLVNETEASVEVEASATVKVRWIVVYSAATEGTFQGLEAITERELLTGDIQRINPSKLLWNAYRI